MPDLNIRDLNKDGGLRRFGEVRFISADDRTVELSFSSEIEVSRWFGVEVLSHEPDSIRMDRIETGAALLVNHDWDDQVGVVDKVEIGSDRRGRAVVRFGRSDRAEEIFRDVQDGIRKHVSVGYLVHKVEVESRKGAPDLVRVIDWEPYEISIVAVPADPSVGIGRNLPVDVNIRTMEGQMPDENLNQNPAPQPAPAPVIDVARERAQAAEGERSRVRSIMEMGEQYGLADLARDYARDGKSVDEFKSEALKALNAKRGGRGLDEGDGGKVGMSDADVGRYSVLRALRALANPTDTGLQKAAAFEFEASRAAAEATGKDPKGIIIPADVLTRAIMPKSGERAVTTSASGVGAGNTGGYTISTDLMSQSFVDMLRNRSTIMQLGTSMGGLIGNVEIPRQASGATGFWQGEDDAATESNLEFDQIGMTPKTVAALSEITRKLLMQSSIDVEALVRRDLATALALTIDLSGYYGTGSANQPRGIANYTGINAVDFGAPGDLPTYAQIVQMETEVAADNADVGSMAYVGNARMRGHLKTTQKFSGTDGAPIWEPGNTVNGYRTEITNQISNGDLFFGNFADVLIGMWGGLEITVDPFTHSARGRLRIVAMQDVDVVLRRVQSFTLGRGV